MNTILIGAVRVNYVLRRNAPLLSTDALYILNSYLAEYIPNGWNPQECPQQSFTIPPNIMGQVPTNFTRATDFNPFIATGKQLSGSGFCSSRTLQHNFRLR